MELVRLAINGKITASHQTNRRFVPFLNKKFQGLFKDFWDTFGIFQGLPGTFSAKKEP